MSSSTLARFRGAGRSLFTRRSWKFAGLWLRGCRALVVDLAGIAGVVILVLFIWREATREVVQIDPIGVPPDLARNGYSGEVIAQRLMDHILKIQKDANTTIPKRAIGTMLTRQVGMTGGQADIVVPGVGFSVGTVAAYVGDLIGTRRTKIKGELTDQGDVYVLSLRVEGVGMLITSAAVPEDKLGDALKAGAEEIVRATEPYVLASYHYDIDKAKALAEADDIIKNAERGSEPQVRAYNLRGLILDGQQRHTEALASYRAAIALDRGYAAAHANMADTLLDMGKLDEAIASYRAAISLDPDNVATRANFGNALHDQGKLDEAIASYRKAIALDPGVAIIYSNLCDALRSRNRPEEAMENCRKAIEIDPNYAYAHNNLANLLDDERRYEEAIASYQTAIELNPTRSTMHNNLGNAFVGAAQFDKAIASYRKAIELDPGSGDPYFNLAQALYSKGDYKEAADSYRQAIERDPANAAASHGLGNALSMQDDIAGAIDAYKKALAVNPRYSEVYERLGDLAPNSDDAIDNYRHAIEVDPKNAYALRKLGGKLIEIGRTEEAVTYYRKAVEADPGLPLIYGDLGVALERLGKEKEAVGDAAAAETARRQACDAFAKSGWADWEDSEGAAASAPVNEMPPEGKRC